MDMVFGEYRLRQPRARTLGARRDRSSCRRGPSTCCRRCSLPPDSLLDKEALFAAAWPGAIVEDNTLQVHMSALRKALGTGYITTVHGRGYKYIGPPPHAAGAVPVAEADARGNIERYRSECIEREAEAKTVAGLLEQHRLVSIVGPGGVGKTTLAIAVADGLEAPGGVWLIDLASLDSGTFIDSTLIQALGVPYRSGTEALQLDRRQLRQAPRHAAVRQLRTCCGRGRARHRPAACRRSELAGADDEPDSARPCRRAGVQTAAVRAGRRGR